MPDMGGSLGVEDFLSGDGALPVEWGLAVVLASTVTNTVLQSVQTDRG